MVQNILFDALEEPPRVEKRFALNHNDIRQCVRCAMKDRQSGSNRWFRRFFAQPILRDRSEETVRG